MNADERPAPVIGALNIPSPPGKFTLPYVPEALKFPHYFQEYFGGTQIDISPDWLRVDYNPHTAETLLIDIKQISNTPTNPEILDKIKQVLESDDLRQFCRIDDIGKSCHDNIDHYRIHVLANPDPAQFVQLAKTFETRLLNALEEAYPPVETSRWDITERHRISPVDTAEREIDLPRRSGPDYTLKFGQKLVPYQEPDDLRLPLVCSRTGDRYTLQEYKLEDRSYDQLLTLANTPGYTYSVLNALIFEEDAPRDFALSDTVRKALVREYYETQKSYSNDNFIQHIQEKYGLDVHIDSFTNQASITLLPGVKVPSALSVEWFLEGEASAPRNTPVRTEIALQLVDPHGVEMGGAEAYPPELAFHKPLSLPIQNDEAWWGMGAYLHPHAQGNGLQHDMTETLIRYLREEAPRTAHKEGTQRTKLCLVSGGALYNYRTLSTMINKRGMWPVTDEDGKIMLVKDSAYTDGPRVVLMMNAEGVDNLLDGTEHRTPHNDPKTPQFHSVESVLQTIIAQNPNDLEVIERATQSLQVIQSQKQGTERSWSARVAPESQPRSFP